MVSVASLLNPIPQSFERHRDFPSPCSSRYTPGPSPPLPPSKKQKISKDAAIFAKGKTKGEIRYQPCEIQTDEIAAQHERFRVFPVGHIADYCRHIPYNSDKKSFLEKTGRESFEVFQYTFRAPDDDREYTVMWDYNIGLVRITPFFKCCKYSKTTPAKMLNANPGLRDICHSITGGALAAQGYWMPYEAAKAVAATFCYQIRYALTPVFGVDFLSLCIRPEDPSFGRMIISRSIVRQCTEAARGFRALSREASLASSPQTPASQTSYPAWTPKSFRHKAIKDMDMESEYSTDTDRSDKYLFSPPNSLSSRWTALNTPRSANTQQFQLPSPKQTMTPASISEDNISQGSSSSEESGLVKHNSSERDQDYNEDSSSPDSSVEVPVAPKRRKKPMALTKEARAAYTLMQLKMADATLRESACRTKRRRASS